MKYPQDFINKIICGDCLEVMKKLPANSIDTIITDPPYGIGFMGKEWDTFKGDYIEKHKKELNKQLEKRPRTDGRNVPVTGIAMRAGQYDFSPKGMIGFQKWITEVSKEMLRVTKPGGTMLIFGGTRTYHRMACAIEDAGWILKDCIMWLYGSGFPKATDISQQLDKQECRKQLEKKLGRKPTKEEFKKEWEGFRKIIGKKQHAKKDFKNNLYAQDPANKNNEKVFGYGEEEITIPAISEAKLWNGWKSHGLKPAYEPIIVAMKPNEGSYANNALKHGVAGLNINGGRIEHKEDLSVKRDGHKLDTNKQGWGFRAADRDNRGRFPSNIILDQEAAKMLDEQSGIKCGQLAPTTGKEPSVNKLNQIYGDYRGYASASQPKDGLGGASRFFYVAKASKAERNAGCEGLEEKIGGGLNATVHGDSRTGRKTMQQNNHPTVKPLKLMEYLCMLTKTPTGGVVLDMFAGSGSTGLACQNTGRDYILIEKEPEYCKIAKARLSQKRQKNLL